ncbi:MAG TPA: hypothetical protein VFF30_13475 [Nitrososphaerales archaeon]|nr:hypothetical protein [Nitrososphaerales archaeon]
MTLNALVIAGLIFLVSMLGVTSSAASANVTMTTYQADSGMIANVYFEPSFGPGSATPSTNSAQSPSSNSGSYTISRGSSAHIWSPQFPSSVTMSAGIWGLDLWAAGSKSGSMKISFYVTDSSGAIQRTIVSNVATQTIGTGRTQVVSTFSISQVSIPAAGYIEAVLTAPTGSSNPSSFTIHWGSGQQTNFQVPYMVLST